MSKTFNPTCEPSSPSRGDADVAHSLDITQTSAQAMLPATLNAQVAAALAMRARSPQDPDERKEAEEQLHQVLQRLRTDTVQHLKAVAWGLPDPTSKVAKDRCYGLGLASAPSRAAERKATEQGGQVSIDHVPQESVRLQLAAASDLEETPLELLDTAVEEKNHTHLAKGTKRALLGGGGIFNGLLRQQKNDPHLTLSGGAWVLFAIADIFSLLEDHRSAFVSVQKVAWGPRE